MRIDVILFMLVVLTILGCNSFQPVEVLPDDFELYSEESAIHLEWGQYILKVDSENNAIYTQRKGFGMEMIDEFKVEEEKLLEIYNEALKKDFFEMEDYYEDPSIMDGGKQIIGINGGGKNKRVTLVNYYVPELDTLEMMIFNLVPQEIRDKKFIDLCPEMMTECSEDNLEVCIEWREFCGEQ